ncbi:MAG: ABC transporter substrate-binding protein, partial [Bacillota bacterium]
DAAIDGYGVEAHGPLPPTIWGYWEGVEDISYKYDPQKAAELLDDAGWELPEGEQYRRKGDEVLELSLYIMPADDWVITSEMLQAQWKDIEVKVDIESYEVGTLMEYLSEGRHDLNLMGYGSTDPDCLYGFFHSEEAGAGVNWCFVRDSDIDAALEGQRYTVDPDERLTHITEAQRLTVERATWAPIYIRENYVAVNKRVQGFGLSYSGAWLLHDVWLDGE